MSSGADGPAFEYLISSIEDLKGNSMDANKDYPARPTRKRGALDAQAAVKKQQLGRRDAEDTEKGKHEDQKHKKRI